MGARIVLLALLTIAAVAAWRAYGHVVRRRLRRLAPGDALLAGVRRGQAAVVYFSTPQCAPCRTQQAPALRRLAAEAADAVAIIEVDAVACPEVAARWYVLTAPTTVVLDGRRRPRHVNRGVATYAVLRAQLDGVLAAARPGG
ncbi:MAG TPA: thioredoxin family protein [Gemmatimonadales bacterium]|nr:thioredoxin family protein [Gemmatimonadales bacterium]